MASVMKQKLERDLLVRNRLLAERDVVKGFVENYNHTLDSSRIPVHLDNLKRINEEFNAVQSRIELADSLDHLESHLLARCEFFDQFCKLKGALLSKSSQNHSSHVSPAHRKQPTVPVRTQVPQKEEEEAIFMVAGPSQIPVARAATPKPKPNAPGNVSRHSPSQCLATGKQSVCQRRPELVSVRNPILPDRLAEERSSCCKRSRPPQEVASNREASGPIVRSNPSQQPIPSTSAHVGTSGSAHPVESLPTSQAKAIHVQGEKVHPPIGDLYDLETRSEEEEVSRSTKLTAALVATPVVTHPRNEAVVHPGEAESESQSEGRSNPGIRSNPKAATAAHSEIASPSDESSDSGSQSNPKAAAAARAIGVPNRPESEAKEEVVRRIIPADGGNPRQAATPPEDSAEKVLRERERATSSKPARWKTKPVTEPQAVPRTNALDASSAQVNRYLSIGDGLPLEIGRIVDISARVSSSNDASPPVSQPPNPSRVPSQTNSAQPSCGKPHEDTTTRIRPGKHTQRFLPSVCPLVAIRCSHAPASARERSCRVRRERTAPTFHRRNRFPPHARICTKDLIHYHATREAEARRRKSVSQPGSPRKPVRPANHLKPSSKWDYKLPQKPPDHVNPSVRCLLKFPVPTTAPRFRIRFRTRAEQFPCEERCDQDRAATEVATDPAQLPPAPTPKLSAKPHTTKYGTILASSKLSAVEALPSVEKRWKNPPWPSEIIRRSWHTAAPLETTETLHADRIALLQSEPCSRKHRTHPRIPRRNTHVCCSTKTGRADRI